MIDYSTLDRAAAKRVAAKVEGSRAIVFYRPKALPGEQRWGVWAPIEGFFLVNWDKEEVIGR